MLVGQAKTRMKKIITENMALRSEVDNLRPMASQRQAANPQKLGP